MRKVTDFIVNRNKLILILFLVLSIFCIYLMGKVNINSDMSKYLPKTSETKIGNDIMNKEFDPIKSSTLYVMFENLDDKDKTLKEIENIKNVDSVFYSETKKYKNKKYDLFTINVKDTSDSKVASNVYNEVNKQFKNEKITLDGDIAQQNTPVLPTWIVALAISTAVLILLIMSDNLIEPFLILYSVGIAVFLNKGSNIIFDNVSSVTDGIVAVLQMALSMDYSIILINRFKQEKKHFKTNKEAMKEALYKSVGAIASSSLTTIVGLLVLVFMSFTIGRDLGIVLAKGVLLSLVSIFFCLPGLLLMFDKLILKTHKKILELKFVSLSKFIYKIRYVTLIIILLLFPISYVLKGNLGYLYTEPEVNKIEKIFKKDNQMALIYNNDDEEFISNYCNNFNNSENVKKVLCYGNTINKDVKYNELKDQIEFLGEDINDVDDYKIKMIYYNYYNKNTDNRMSFYEFVDFIRTDIYSKDEFEDKVNEYRNDIERLKYFTYVDNINQERDVDDLSNIFGISKDDLELLLVYYNSKQDNNVRLTLNEFVDFINSDIINSKYDKYLDDNSKKDLEELSKYINKDEINKKMTSLEIANYFNIDEDLVDKLFVYYLINSDIDTNISIREFTLFVLNDVKNDSFYSKYLSEDTIDNLNKLKNFTDINYINTEVGSKELADTFDIDEESVKKLLYLYYKDIDSNDSYTLIELLTYLKDIKENTNYLDDINIEEIIYSSDYINYKIDKELLYNYFDEDFINGIYDAFGLDDDFKFSISDILTIVSNYLDEDTKVKLKEYLDNAIELSQKIIDNLPNYIDEDILNDVKNYINDKIDEINSNSKKYTSSELADLLGIDKSITNNIYTLIKLYNNDTDDWKLSRYEFVNHLLNNSEYLDSEQIDKLELLNVVMNSTLNDTKYKYNELANALSIDSDKLKSLYALYTYKHYGLKLNPNETIKFVINHQNDDMLKGYLNSYYLDRVYLVNKIFDSVNNNDSYNYQELAEFLGIDADKVKLLYSIYYNSNNSTYIDIKTLTNFIVNDVLNSEYSSSFSDKDKNDIKTINGIVNSSIDNIKYTKDEMIAILSKLSPDISKDTMSLLYMYYGSSKEYDDNYTLTIEKLVNYLNDDILNDDRFIEFIDDDMKNRIVDSKDTIRDAKELLVGDNYSRMLFITEYGNEGSDTFNFIKDTRGDLNKIDDKYLIGNSPMAYDISKSFDSEFNFISLLTLASIFIVVALTFKSIISPLIISLIIQCSVYVTMGILAFQGDPVYFISLLVVQSILMGATIDYGIVFTSYYLDIRKDHNVKDAVAKAYRKSSHTIFTSGTILILVTFTIGIFADGVVSKICMTLSKGTLCSVVLIILILPGVMAALDKIIFKHRKITK